MNRNNEALIRDISPEEFDLISGGNAASDEVVEEQIETVTVTGSYGGVSSGTINSLGANYGGGYGSFLQAYIPGAVGTAARAAVHEAGEDLETAGNWTMTGGTIIGLMGNAKLGSRVSGIGGVLWISGQVLQTIELNLHLLMFGSL